MWSSMTSLLLMNVECECRIVSKKSCNLFTMYSTWGHNDPFLISFNPCIVSFIVLKGWLKSLDYRQTTML
jgi:hypothetical protein